MRFGRFQLYYYGQKLDVTDRHLLRLKRNIKKNMNIRKKESQMSNEKMIFQIFTRGPMAAGIAKKQSYQNFYGRLKSYLRLTVK